MTSGEFVTLARVRKTQGRRGEVAVELHTDVPERFHAGFKVSALLSGGAQRELEVDELWPHKGLLVLKFKGIETISEAEELVGAELQVARAERRQLEAGWNYISDLIGCKVFDGGREVGVIADVKFGAGEAPLLEVSAGKRICEIPYAEAYLVKVDLGAKRIEMQLPEGMLELDAPLTPEEKKHNSGG
ncbi:MAG TPA: ribosome maturation factor RimM [Terriglobales bacterium]